MNTISKTEAIVKNKLTELFERKKKNILSVFFTAGYPKLNDTEKIIRELQSSGVDLIEVGIPFSDPLADGPVIQQSSEQALKNGMNLELLFAQLSEIKNEISIPLVLMGYVNPVMQFGVEKFVQKCKETGISGVILPDLPLEVYRNNYQELFEKNELSNIFLITPKTDPERIKQIDSVSTGFIYLVSSSSTTGKKATLNEDGFKKIKDMKLKNPLMIGFGISDKTSFLKACELANGAIIGSAFVKAIAKGKPEEKVPAFISTILN